MSIVIATSINIDATRGQVWEVLADFTSYGEWSNFSRVEGEARVGERLAMRMPGFAFSATVRAAVPGERLEWAARILRDGIFLGRHTFVLTDNPDGSTHLANTETFSGALVWPFQGLFRRRGGPRETGYDGFNRALKRRVEAHAAGRDISGSAAALWSRSCETDHARLAQGRRA